MVKKMEYIALDRRVLVVAVEGEVKDWAAYICAVEGTNHDREVESVYRHGTKISREIAEFLFPEWAKKFQWRY